MTTTGKVAIAIVVVLLLGVLGWMLYQREEVTDYEINTSETAREMGTQDGGSATDSTIDKDMASVDAEIKALSSDSENYE